MSMKKLGVRADETNTERNLSGTYLWGSEGREYNDTRKVKCSKYHEVGEKKQKNKQIEN